MTQVKLMSADGVTFEVDIEVARCSLTIKTLLDDLGLGSEPGDEEVIPLPNVKSHILKKIITWATHHKDDPPKSGNENKREKKQQEPYEIDSWDAEFLKVDQLTMFELILAANYLDIQALLDVSCKTVANMIKGKTPAEIRQVFCIQSDYSEAEAEQVRLENEWCEDAK